MLSVSQPIGFVSLSSPWVPLQASHFVFFQLKNNLFSSDNAHTSSSTESHCRLGDAVFTFSRHIRLSKWSSTISRWPGCHSNAASTPLPARSAVTPGKRCQPELNILLSEVKANHRFPLWRILKRKVTKTHSWKQNELFFWTQKWLGSRSIHSNLFWWMAKAECSERKKTVQLSKDH